MSRQEGLKSKKEFVGSIDREREEGRKGGRETEKK